MAGSRDEAHSAAVVSPNRVDGAIELGRAVGGPAPAAGRPVAVEARAVTKTFRIPEHRIDTFKERAVHPFARQRYRELEALNGVSFDVHRGEFFGVVGRNGSGKSTLLKILASIYRADGGRVRMAGRVAPFIELGVGFNHELSARENVVLNGVIMGLSQREARRRLDAVLDFAELREFVDLKLKNYSAGMLVRLAFAVMIQAEADILLIDEVLTVGDAAFQQKCADVFHEMRATGRKTIVLVTHDMTAVGRYCHRGMLLHEGEMRYVGGPHEVGRQYFKLNFEEVAPIERAGPVGPVPDLHAHLVDAWLENASGERITNVEVDEPVRLHAVIEAQRDLLSPSFGFHCVNADGIHVFEFNRKLSVDDGQPNLIVAGKRVRISGTIENRLMPGRYFLSCWVGRTRDQGEVALQVLQLIDFVVFGARPGIGTLGVVAVENDVRAVPEERSGP
jgi:ABC-type polysaccharide/polyol phosphate transport system ATPase subunit